MNMADKSYESLCQQPNSGTKYDQEMAEFTEAMNIEMGLLVEKSESKNRLPFTEVEGSERLNSCKIAVNENAGASTSRPKRLSTTRYANCPLCDSSLSPANACKHLEEEKERLTRWHQNVKRSKKYAKVKRVKESEDFQNVRARRNERCLAMKEKLKPWLNASCPLCATEFSSGASEVFEHIYSCQNAAVFRQNALGFDENQPGTSSAFENDESSIEVADLAEITSASVVRLSNGDEDLPLDVETLDEEEFGEEQYSKDDVELLNSQIGNELPPATPQAPTDLPSTSSAQNSPSPAVAACTSSQNSSTSAVVSNDVDCKPSTSVTKPECSDAAEVVVNPSDSPESIKVHLKLKIQELMRDSAVCAVCMGPYKTPLVSISCWHVLCEECWLRALAVSKLCPLCKDIISPGKLRKLYI